MRTASRLDATLSGADQGDALSQLEIDHRRVDSLFARASLSPHGPARRALVDQILEELTTHAELEETVVYPRIAQALPAAPWLVETSVEEHDEMRTVMAVLRTAEDEQSMLIGIRALQLIVQAHVAVEEGEIFPAFRQMATPDTLRSLDDEAAAHRAGGSR
ncbi:MAG: hemerythrin domain-containing protein [Acidimicrobiales bacterium]